MSWDFYLEHKLADDLEANYTYNVGPMFYDAIPGGIRALDGCRGDIAGKRLDDAIKKLTSDPQKYEAMNPPNGWGDYRGALTLLITLRSWCSQFPTGTLRVT